MTILGLDLTGAIGSMAVVDDGEVVIEEIVTSPDGFGHLLFDPLRNMLSAAGLTVAQLDGYASSTGPGSFTGVRVSLAVAKGLAEATGKPAFGVSNLRALASTGSGPLRVPILDARRGDVYAALYRADQAEVLPESVGPFDKFLSLLAEYDGWQLITTDLSWLHSSLPTGYVNSPATQSAPALATAIAQCAFQDMQQGASGDPALLDANYVRRSDAESYWHDVKRPLAP